MRVFVALLAFLCAAGCSTEPPIAGPIEPEPLQTGFPLEPSDDRPNRSESELFERLADALKKQPVTAAAVARAFNLQSECATHGCHFGQTAIGGMVARKGEMRFDRNGLIFELDDISGKCVRASVMARHFEGGGVEQSCLDAQCWYYKARQSWGTLSFELPEPRGGCVKSVMIDTYRQSN
ncbi:hypothetical protein [Sphingomonas alba]|uniref:Lipoprotein n=1 Tax=Sphingomonas alba TaxID=2908208 RepID=A0ABT0RLM7_9SPHN|nr:hypothetical protein [Sphingomonas alba]MCL6683551.1 hypothetical protein [Sphingomonas alba]